MVIATAKLSAIPYGQATVNRHDDGTIVLVSYSTPVAFIDPNGWLNINGLYSATTRKHIGAFVKEYANIYYQTAKRIYEDGLAYNIHTGEVAKW